MSGTIPPLLLYAFKAWTGTTLHLFFHCYYFHSLALKGILTTHRMTHSQVYHIQNLISYLFSTTNITYHLQLHL